MSNQSLQDDGFPDYVWIPMQQSGYVFAGIIVVLTAWFCYFLGQKQKGTTIFNAAPAEKLIVLLGLTTATNFIFVCYSFYVPDLVESLIVTCICYLTQQLFYIFYIRLSWVRSESIIKRVYKDYYIYLNYFCGYGFPFMMLLPIPFWIINVWNYYGTVFIDIGYASVAFIILVPVISGVFDLFLLLSFVAFLSKTRTDESDPIEPKFAIIAYYSGAASFFMILMAIADFVMISPLIEYASSITQMLLYYISQIVVCGIVWFVLTMMKVVLVLNEQLTNSGRTLSSRMSQLFPFTKIEVSGGKNTVASVKE